MSEKEDAQKAKDANAIQQEHASKIFASIVKVSKYNPIAATQMLKVESEHGDNPYLQQLKGITFNANTKNGWATVAAPDGYVYLAYLLNLPEAVHAGPDSDLYKQTVIRIGDHRPDKPTVIYLKAAWYWMEIISYLLAVNALSYNKERKLS